MTNNLSESGIRALKSVKSKKFFSNVFLIYLCLAPINWIPLVPLVIVNVLKYFLFAILLIICISNQGHPRKINSFFSFPYYVLILICALPAILFAYSDVLTNIIDISFLFLMNYVIVESSLTKDELFRIFLKVSVFIGAICLLSLLSAISGITIDSPPPWKDPFSKSALGGYRTGWSNSIFLFMPFLFYAYFFSGERKWKTISLLAIIGILSSQILSGGRAGLVGSLFTFLFFTRFKIQNVVILIIIVVSAYAYLGPLTIEEYFRASEDQIEVKEGSSTLDKISSGRVSVYQLGWKLFKGSPFIGNGFGASLYFTDGPDIHNTWLKRLVDGGILFVLPIIFLFISLYNTIIKKTRRYYNSENHKVLIRSLFISSIFISMLEPNYLIGSFQGEAFFWALVSTYLK